MDDEFPLPTYTIVPAIDQGEQLKRIADALETISHTLEEMQCTFGDCTSCDDYGKLFRVRNE